MNWQWFKLARKRKSLLILDNVNPPRWLYRWCRWRWSWWARLRSIMLRCLYPRKWQHYEQVKCQVRQELLNKTIEEGQAIIHAP